MLFVFKVTKQFEVREDSRGRKKKRIATKKQTGSKKKK
jgi:hypothetical protein